MQVTQENLVLYLYPESCEILEIEDKKLPSVSFRASGQADLWDVTL